MGAGLLAKRDNSMTKKNSLIKKIELSGLTGRGGAAFSVFKKITRMGAALKSKKQGYIIINAAEGEPGVKKDAYILENKTEELMSGVNLVLKFLGTKKISNIYFFISKKYYQAYQKKIKNILKQKKYQGLNKKIIFCFKPEAPVYICGEETTILNIIEKQRTEPRLKPPFPIDSGLFGRPTLTHNVETFYDIHLIDKEEYIGERLYTLVGAVKHRGVFSLPAHFSVLDILKATNNFPSFDFFVMTGGQVCGELLNKDQLGAPVEGSGLLMVFNKKQTNLKKLLNYWLSYYQQESCGACTACREGTYRLVELFKKNKAHEDLFNDLLDNLEESSLCGLGSSLAQTVKSFQNNIK